MASLTKVVLLSVITAASSLRVSPSANIGESPFTVELDFAGATLAHSNLGGLGPNTSFPETMLMKGITEFDGVSVDLEIEAINSYMGNTKKNVINADFGQINLAPGQNVTFVFHFLNGATGKPFTLPYFHLTFWDLDTGARQGVQEGFESVHIGPIQGYRLTESTEIEVMPHGDAFYTFKATQVGVTSDNPTDVVNLTPLQMNRAVEGEFLSMSKIMVNLVATDAGWGRTFMFSGKSKQFEDNTTETEVGPCQEYKGLDFSSATLLSRDIVGTGMRYGGVASVGATTVDLVVKAGTGYSAFNEGQNGLNGASGQVNFAGWVNTELTFSFVEAGTTTPISLSRFFFSIMDLDNKLVGKETIFMPHGVFLRHWLGPKSSVVEAPTDMGVFFNSTEFGSFANNPGDPKMLSPEQAEHAVTFFADQAVSSFTMGVVIRMGNPGRNINFGGVTNFVCPE